MTAKPCPFCGTPDPMVIPDPDMCWLVCVDPKCGVEGPVRDSEAEAIAAWNLAIRVPTDPKARCHHLEHCAHCNPALEGRR